RPGSSGAGAGPGPTSSAAGGPRLGLPSAEEVMARASGENFPVASRVLPRPVRGHLLAIYGFARLVDQLGDEVAGDRSAHLDWLEAELDRAYHGRATHPVLTRLTPTLSALQLRRRPFLDLIQANRQDQVVTRYETYADLLGYCRLSADPVGRLVLAVFGASTPDREALSDQVCTGLQLVEHTQDIAEDAARGRIYLPARDMDRFGCSQADLARPTATPALRALVALQVARARALLDAGAPLAATLPGRAKVTVAGFAGGGQAALDAVQAADFDVLGTRPRAGRLAVARRMVAGLAASRTTGPPAKGGSR
ncbi:MAG: squalene synthase HpnC, partial [Acidimicrobiales bacterium]